jgi:hypothetical protein
MKRVLANFALAAIVSTFAWPLLVSLQRSETPACCRPGGKHHCGQKPNGTGFQSKTDACPYASHFLATSFTGLSFAKFEMTGLGGGGFILVKLASTDNRVAGRLPSDRGPPALSL